MTYAKRLTRTPIVHFFNRSLSIEIQTLHTLAEIPFADEWEVRLLAAKSFDRSNESPCVEFESSAL